MASWKKLIVSGSDAVLSTVTVDTCVVGTLCGNAATATAAGQVSVTDVSDSTAYGIALLAPDGTCSYIGRDSVDNISFNPSASLLTVPYISATCISGSLCGEAAAAVTVRAQSTTEATVHEIPFINYNADGQYGLCVRSTVTFNPDSNELRTFGICGCSYICGGNVRGNYICSVGAVCSATITTSGNAIIGGDLTVNGTTTYLNTTNLAVEDRFILLNSGSNTPREAGLVVDEGAPSGSGHAFVYDNDTSRWGFTSSLASTTGSVAPDAFAVAVVTQQTCGVGEYQKVGNIFVCTNSQDIYIWS